MPNPLFPALGHLTQTGRSQPLAKRLTIAALCASLIAMPLAHAEGPGRGATAQYERDYLTFIIDHHYSALRMTELAAGTDLTRDADPNNPQEGTSPTPGTAATPPKAGMADIKSMARMANRMQREEIQTAQKLLKEWYGVTHMPALRNEGRQLIQALEQTAAGAPFEQAFLQLFSNHHYAALHPSLDCQVKSDIDHHKLQGYCEGIVHNQVREINDMRDMLCKQFSVCDFQPAPGTTVRASSSASAVRQ